MNIYRFEKKYTDLPEVIPLFPLNNVLLLPKCKLPLNLFENRYLHMFDSALSTDRIIGMIQPSENLKSHKDVQVLLSLSTKPMITDMKLYSKAYQDLK